MLASFLLYLGLLGTAGWLAFDSYRHSPATPLQPRLPWRIVALLCLLMIVFYATRLQHMWDSFFWLTDLEHGESLMDFSCFYGAARARLFDGPLAIYDWQNIHMRLNNVAGQMVPMHRPFYYPPPFLFFIMPLALFSYTTAGLVWIGATLLLFTLACIALWPRRITPLIALAAPATALVLLQGQTGLLVAALFALALAALPRRPLLAGVFFGLLIIKPQFGVLVPLLLLAGRQYRCFAAASLTALAFLAASYVAFGGGMFPAGLTAMQTANSTILHYGAIAWVRFQSFYGLSMLAGLPLAAAMAVQLLLAAALAVYGFRLWRGDAPYALKAAFLALSALAISPYCFMYDLALSSVALLLLLKDGQRQPHHPLALAAMALAYVLPASVPFLHVAFGQACMALLFMVLVLRVRAAANARPIQSPDSDPAPR